MPRVAQIVRTEAKISDFRVQFSEDHSVLPPSGGQKGLQNKAGHQGRGQRAREGTPQLGQQRAQDKAYFI